MGEGAIAVGCTREWIPHGRSGLPLGRRSPERARQRLMNAAMGLDRKRAMGN